MHGLNAHINKLTSIRNDELRHQVGLYLSLKFCFKGKTWL